jgi:hypothetical protein
MTWKVLDSILVVYPQSSVFIASFVCCNRFSLSPSFLFDLPHSLELARTIRLPIDLLLQIDSFAS